MSFIRINNAINRRSRSRSLTALLMAGLCSSIAILSSGCKSGYPVSARNTSGEAREPRPVTVAKVSEISMERTVTVTGTLAAYDQAAVSAKVPGRLESIAVDLGTVVRQGQKIAQIEQQ